MVQRTARLRLLICALFALIAHVHFSFAADLFTYGTGTALYRNDDGYSGPISISTTFPFFGNPQSTLYVCTNGIISFGSGVSSYTPSPFPVSNNPVVAPFWGDIDIRTSGNIYYRQVSGSDLNQLTSAVGVNGFSATWGYIVTWDRVPAFPGGGTQFNTFQAALCTDGSASFVIFNYQELSWTIGTASDIPAQVGFDAGDGVHSYAHEWSRSAAITGIVTGSNVNVPGRYIYGVAAAVIQPVDEVVVVDPCEDVNCNDGTCSDGACTCTHGYEGTYCDTITDNCATQTCTDRGTCDNRVGSYTCHCNLGYEGTNCETVINWCERNSITCNSNGDCSNLGDNTSWQCTCHCGYTGTACDAQLCLGTYCHNLGICGEIGCECVSPWSGTDCQTENSACTNVFCDHGSCTGSGQCTCDSGYTQGTSTSLCDIEQCGSINCHNGGTCDSGECTCIVGWTGGQCTQEDLCHGTTCNGHGHCVVYNGNAICRCDDSSFGPDASGDLSQQCSQHDCSDDTTCENGGICNSEGGCDCVYPYTGATCSSLDYCNGGDGIDCSSGECGATDSGFECTCADYTQFWMDPRTMLCTSRMCSCTNMCRNGGTCAGDSCSCGSAYSGTYCEIWDGCYSVTCQNGGFCRDNQHNDGDYYCDCADGFHGRHCELQRCTNDVTCYNGGLCNPNGCDCPVEWSGSDCTTEQPAVCRSYDCGTGGTCSGTSSAVCTCQEGYSQSDSSAPCTLTCGDMQCENGGLCNDEDTCCLCQPGWYGRGGCHLEDPCADVECHSSRGSCNSYQGVSRCECVLGIYSGDDCSSEVCSDGSQEECFNGGSCSELDGCECPYPYEGDQCETINYCPDDNCGYGTCRVRSDGGGAECTCDASYIVDQYTGLCTTQYTCTDGYTFCMHGGECNAAGTGCQCPDGYTGDNCETRDLCADNECLHGICVPHDDTVSHTCECEPGWMGAVCNMQRCYAGMVCQNGAWCSIEGCICTPGWTGDECTTPLAAACYTDDHNMDCGYGYCEEGGTCSCISDHGLAADNRCTRVRCGVNDCQNGATCVDSTCVCPRGFYGDDCADSECQDIDCGMNGRCHMMDDASNQCVCDDSRWSADDCSVETCTDASTCQNGGSCVHGGQPCACVEGFTGEDCSTVDVCSGRDCMNGGVCHEVDGSAVCCCADGYLEDPFTGLCTIQQCLHHMCMNNQSCSSADMCECSAPFSGSHCQDVDYCDSRTCTSRGSCRETIDESGNSLRTYDCVCEDGFHGDDCQYQFCTDNIVCFNGGVCTTDYGCNCASGYGGPSCEVEYSAECVEMSCVHGYCVTRDGDLACECISDSWGGDDCNTHMCNDGTSCQNGGTCVDGSADSDVTTALFPDSFCFCAHGYTGADCSEANPCADVDCNRHGRCLVIDDVAQCVCYDDRWTGAHCASERCSNSLTCQNGGSCTEDGTCECTAAFTGDACDTLDSCNADPCANGDCTASVDGFECTCSEGYTQGITGICDTMWCTTDETFCMNGGTCLSHDTYSTCMCPPGITGTNCETVDHCFNQDCNQHGVCQNDLLSGGYTCHCSPGWIGQDCSMQLCIDTTCMNNGVCGYDGCRCTVGWTGATCEERVDIDCQGVECGDGTCQVDYTGLDTMEEGYVQGCSETATALVMENIETAALTASSETESMGASSGVLNSGSAWSPELSDLDQWLQVDFQDDKVISSISTQGHENGHVTGYHVSYSGDGSQWVWIRDAADSRYTVFMANDDAETVATRDLAVPVIARIVRLHPVTWMNDIYMTFDVHGCTFDQTGACSCSESYTTDAAGVCSTIMCDDSFSCQNGGTCITHYYDGEPACLCMPGFHGRDCSDSACDGFDCHGNGRCEVLYDGTAACICDHSRWTHDEALSENGYCLLEMCSESLTCENGGQCMPRPSDETTVCVCPYPYTGDACDTYEECSTDVCVNGECYPDFVYNTESHCDCADGYIRNADVHTCTTQLCSNGRAFCMHGGNCMESGDACQCPDGISGDYCQTVDYCDGHSDCSGHGTCINIPQEQTFYCACVEGWIGPICDRQRCDDYNTCMNGGFCQADGWNNGCQCESPYHDELCESSDYCEHSACENGTCMQQSDGFVCNCDPGYTQATRAAACNNFISTCTLPDGAIPGPSVIEQCQYGGSCVDEIMIEMFDPEWINGTELEPGYWYQAPDITTANISCDCPETRAGVQCEFHNDCSESLACSGHGMCTASIADGTAMCDCDAGFEGDNCDVHVCPDATTRCNNRGLCNDLNECTCVYSYAGDTCNRLDSCDYVNCYNGVCSQEGESFSCLCEEGYILNERTGECSTQLCNDDEDTFCMNYGVCEEPNTCLCHEEWIDHNCETYNWCWNQTCSGRGQCVNEEFDYHCGCDIGFYGRDCHLQACYDGMVCSNMSVCSNSTGCQCQYGYTGPDCDVMDPCATANCGTGGVCVEDGTIEFPRLAPIYWTADYYCVSANDVDWNQSDATDSRSPFDVHTCLGDNDDEYYCYNDGICVSTQIRRRVYEYSCGCTDGWLGDDCSIRDPCIAEGCSGHGSCHVNADFSANCTCEDNYMGDNCNIDYCPDTDTQCMNGGTCPRIADAWCICPYHYTGDTCELEDWCVERACGHGSCLAENGECECEDGWIHDYHTGACTTSMCNDSQMFCMNNGTCTEGMDSCDCPDWYNYNEINPDVDVHCEHWNYCFDQTCSDHGLCINEDNGFSCDCDVGWIGDLCDMQPCVGGITCLNNGVCTPTGCQCLDDYSGDDCGAYDRCGQIDCGVGACVPQPTGEEGCLNDIATSWLSDPIVNVEISSSTVYAGISATHARPSGTGWAAADDDTDPYIQVWFGRDLIVDSISTWGRVDADEWVTEYEVSYSLDGSDYTYIINPLDYYGGHMVYEGNTNDVDEVQHTIDPIVAQYLRIHPVSHHSHVSMRFDVSACVFFAPGYMCNCSAASLPGTWQHSGEDETSMCDLHVCDHEFSTGVNAGQNAMCQNGGVCLDSYDAASQTFCACPDAFTGPFCELENLCFSSGAGTECSSRGTDCVFDVTEIDPESGSFEYEFRCECQDSGSDWIEYSGALCDQVTCNGTVTCQNGAECSDDLLSCACAYPYIGELCTEIDYCATIECLHGECQPTADGFECTCNEGERWIVNTDTGLCSTYVCENDIELCMNEGQCTAELEDPSSLGTCQCRNYDINGNCEVPNQCGPDRDCYGHGDCDRDSGVCDCRNGFSGDDCSSETCRNAETCYNGGECDGRGRSCDCVYPHLDGDRCTEQNWCVGSDRRASTDVNCYNGNCTSHAEGWLAPNTDVWGGYNCLCEDGWEIDGAQTVRNYIHHCTTAVCDDGTRCHNRGTCRYNSRRDSWKCKCKNGFRGRDCSRVVEDNTNDNQQNGNGNSGNVAASVAGAAAGTAAAGSAAGGILFALRRRKKKKEEEELIVEDVDDSDRVPNSSAPNTHQGQTWNN